MTSLATAKDAATAASALGPAVSVIAAQLAVLTGAQTELAAATFRATLAVEAGAPSAEVPAASTEAALAQAAAVALPALEAREAAAAPEAAAPEAAVAGGSEL